MSLSAAVNCHEESCRCELQTLTEALRTTTEELREAWRDARTFQDLKRTAQQENQALKKSVAQLQEDMEHSNYAYHEEQGQHRLLQQEMEQVQERSERRRQWIILQGQRINELEAEVAASLEQRKMKEAEKKAQEKMFQAKESIHQRESRKFNSKMRREAVQLKKSLRKRH